LLEHGGFSALETIAQPSCSGAHSVSGTFRLSSRSQIMAEDDAFAALRARAYELADTGRHDDWDSIAAAIMDEGALPVLVRRVGTDALFKIMLGNRINAARDRR